MNRFQLALKQRELVGKVLRGPAEDKAEGEGTDGFQYQLERSRFGEVFQEGLGYLVQQGTHL